MIVIRDPKTFYFDTDQPKGVDDNLKHEIKFALKRDQSLAENKIKNQTESLLLKYNLENSSNEYEKQQNERTTQICF